VRWYADPGVPDRGGRHGWRAFASRAYAAAAGGAAPGPVHLNLPFREPLVGAPADLPPARPGGRPWVRAVAGGGGAAGGPGPELADLAADLVGRRGIIVAGASGGDGGAAGGDLGTLVHGVAAALGWPVVADPRSAAWRPAGTLVPHLDAVLRAPAVAGGLRPEVVVRLGPPGASRVVDEWLAASGAVEVVAGAPGWSDPASTAAAMVGRATPLLAALAAAAPAVEAPAGWLATWSAAAEAARAAAEGELGPGAVVGGPPVEPAVARAVVGAVPPGTALVVSSSMPIRDVERYAVPRGDVRVLANRGANGIDGVVSTAVGVALAWGGPASLLVGDLAFLHDSNGLLGAAGRGIDLACVVVDNDGGGIFSFLPQARALAGDRFEALFGTPHGLDLVAVASAFGVAARRIDAGEDVAAAVTGAAAAGGVRVLVVPTDRAANVEAHRRVDDAIAAAVQAAVGG
jgi:2-succinyl-5-enolpyruvyl-6-hydroxy-3-cyclohexene-1-carboxylate synthase